MKPTIPLIRATSLIGTLALALAQLSYAADTSSPNAIEIYIAMHREVIGH